MLALDHRNIRAAHRPCAHANWNLPDAQNRMPRPTDPTATLTYDVGAIQEALRGIWEHHRGLVSERIELIERAVEALSAGELDEPLRDEALRAAHMLSGSLGTFGFAGASEAAGALEHEFADPRGAQVPIMRALIGNVRDGIAGGDPISRSARSHQSW